jgi:hypothetical protein
MKWPIRLLAILGMVLTLVGSAGLLLFSAFLCFDVCPPDIGSQVLRAEALLAGPGLAVGLVVCGLSLYRLRASGASRRLLGVVLSLPIMLALTAALWLIVDSGHLLPTTETELGNWAKSLPMYLVIQLAWLVYLYVVGSSSITFAPDAKPNAG